MVNIRDVNVWNSQNVRHSVLKLFPKVVKDKKKPLNCSCNDCYSEEVSRGYSGGIKRKHW